MDQKRIKKLTYLAVVGRRVINDAAMIHCTAQHELTQAISKVPINNARRIPCAIDLSKFREASEQSNRRSPTDRPRLLFLSRLDNKKGVDLLLETVRVLKDAGFDCSLDIAGTGASRYVRKLRTLTESLGLAPDVNFLGHVGEPVRSRLLAEANALILPTMQENFGIVLAEALATGTPVVTTNGVDVWPELLQSGTVKIVDLRQPRSTLVGSLAQAISDAVTDWSYNGTRLATAQSWVENWLDADQVAVEYEAMYDDALCNYRRTQ